MHRKSRLLIAKTAVILAAVPVLIIAHEYGPDAGYVGVPGESASCIAAGCHVGTANSDGGKVEVTFPDGLTYTPGVRQHLVVAITDPAQRRWGFELTARTDPKTMAGTFRPTDNRTQVLCASINLFSQNPGTPGCPASLPLQYMEQTLAGYNVLQPNPGKYEFDWTPPATDVGPITIYVGANAANGDLTERGDHIYTNKYTLTPSAGGGGSKPAISEVGNGAGFQANIQQASWVQIKGSNLASNNRTWTAADFVGGKLPTKLDGVSVSINGKAAAVYFIDSKEIDVWSPLDDSLGPVNVTVTNSGSTSDPFSVRLQRFSPGVFLWPGNHAVTTAGGTLIGPPGLLGDALTTVPAKPGDLVTLWGTGFGPTDPPPPPDEAVPASPLRAMTATPTIRIGGIAAEYGGGALAPFTVGIYQINVKIPANAPDGDLKLEIDIGGEQTPAGALITVKK